MAPYQFLEYFRQTVCHRHLLMRVRAEWCHAEGKHHPLGEAAEAPAFGGRARMLLFIVAVIHVTTSLLPGTRDVFIR